MAKKHDKGAPEEAEMEISFDPGPEDRASESIQNGARSAAQFLNGDGPGKRYVKLAAIVLLLCGLSFGLGRLSVLSGKNSPIEVKRYETAASVFGSMSSGQTAGESEPRGGAGDALYVGSANSDKYHFPWCPGAKRIKEENKVTFASKAEARNAGYEPAANCEGL